MFVGVRQGGSFGACLGVEADEETDEFAQYFKNGVAPKILITTSKGPSAVSAFPLLTTTDDCHGHIDDAGSFD